jgi:predicted HTH transcriptional regulator
MTPEELRRRILAWEGPHTDFKRALGRPIELAKDLVSFANSDGGQLMIGVGRPSGGGGGRRGLADDRH